MIKTEPTPDENRAINETSAESEAAEKKNAKKKTNKTWEAFGKSKGCFIINDPKFLL